jgi:WD40 repeat protein
LLRSYKAGGAVTGAVFYGETPIVSTANGAVKMFGDEETTFTSHAGAVNAIAMHPSGEILASVGVDKSFVFYDLSGKKVVTQVYTDSGTYSLLLIIQNTSPAYKSQNSKPRLSTQMGISLQLVAPMVKSNFST